MREHFYFCWFRKTHSPQNSRKSLKWNLKSKGIFAFFLSFLILLKLRQTKRRWPVNGVRRKRSQIQISEFFNNNIQILRNNLFVPPQCTHVHTMIQHSYSPRPPRKSNFEWALLQMLDKRGLQKLSILYRHSLFRLPQASDSKPEPNPF